jgi:hypothetical protein
MKHAAEAARFIADFERAQWHDQAIWFVRSKRDLAAHGVPEWETLRKSAAQIKSHTMGQLADYLEQFEAQASALGAIVHWARDTQEHNKIVLQILQQHQVRRWSRVSRCSRKSVDSMNISNSRKSMQQAILPLDLLDVRALANDDGIGRFGPGVGR